MSESIVQKEYRLAKVERRQPLCPYCHKPLEVAQTQLSFVVWRWD